MGIRKIVDIFFEKSSRGAAAFVKTFLLWYMLRNHFLVTINMIVSYCTGTITAAISWIFFIWIGC